MPDRGDGSQQSTVALAWSRDGGFAGFCDELKVTASGEATASSCRSQEVKTRKLSSDDLTRLNAWREAFASVSVTAGDGGTADGMTIKLTLTGTGTGQPSDAQRQELLDWAQRVYTQTRS
jgi:hypothetical protein